MKPLVKNCSQILISPISTAIPGAFENLHLSNSSNNFD